MVRLTRMVLVLVMLAGLAWVLVGRGVLVMTTNELTPVFNGNATAAGFITQMLALTLAACIGAVTGWALCASRDKQREAELTQQLFEIKGRIPKLETSTRNQKQHVERLQQELEDWRTKVEPLEQKIEDRERTLGDRERQLTRVQRELEMLKEARGSGEISTDSAMLNSALVGITDNDDELQNLEEELTDRTVELTALREALAEHEQRRKEIKGERERQDKWLDILNKQLETARTDNTRLTEELKELAAARARIRELEGVIGNLKNDIAERDKRLATSRFEVSNARAVAAHLESQLSALKPAKQQ